MSRGCVVSDGCLLVCVSPQTGTVPLPMKRPRRQRSPWLSPKTCQPARPSSRTTEGTKVTCHQTHPDRHSCLCELKVKQESVCDSYITLKISHEAAIKMRLNDCSAFPNSGQIYSFPKHPNQSKTLNESNVRIKSVTYILKKHKINQMHIQWEIFAIPNPLEK